MDRERARRHLCGCYVTVPTMFRDTDLAVDLLAVRKHVRFLIDGGITTGTGVLLSGGAAGDFATLTLAERIQVAETVVDEAQGRVPVVMGAQTTSTRRAHYTARRRQLHLRRRLHPGFAALLFQPARKTTSMNTLPRPRQHPIAESLSIIPYSTSLSVSQSLMERLVEFPNVVGLKWAVPSSEFMEFERVALRYASQFSIIDNQLRFVNKPHAGGSRHRSTRLQLLATVGCPPVDGCWKKVKYAGSPA